MQRRPTIYLRNEDDNGTDGFISVTLDQGHGYIPFGDIAEEFQISSVLECDREGSILPRGLLISDPSTSLRDGGFYIARRANEQRWGQRDGSDYLVGGGGGLSVPSRETLPFLESIGEKRPREEDLDPANRARKGVAFNAKVEVTEFTIGGNSSSDSFRTSLSGYTTSAGRPPSLTASSREPLRALSGSHHHDDWFSTMEIKPFDPYTSDSGELVTEHTVMQWLRNAKDRETIVPLQLLEADRILGEVDAFLADQRAKGMAE